MAGGGGMESGGRGSVLVGLERCLTKIGESCAV